MGGVVEDVRVEIEVWRRDPEEGPRRGAGQWCAGSVEDLDEPVRRLDDRARSDGDPRVGRLDGPAEVVLGRALEGEGRQRIGGHDERRDRPGDPGDRAGSMRRGRTRRRHRALERRDRMMKRGLRGMGPADRVGEGVRAQPSHRTARVGHPARSAPGRCRDGGRCGRDERRGGDTDEQAGKVAPACGGARRSTSSCEDVRAR